MWAALTEHGRLRQLAFGGLDPKATMPLPPPALRETFRFLQRQLDSYFAGTLQTFTIPLDPSGTPFQMQVWEQILAIPYGRTLSYHELAAQIGNEHASQAVGAAVGANPIAILIPCHRVVGADGSLRGYAWGLEIKESLLLIEGALGKLPL